MSARISVRPIACEASVTAAVGDSARSTSASDRSLSLMTLPCGRGTAATSASPNTFTLIGMNTFQGEGPWTQRRPMRDFPHRRVPTGR